MPTSHLRTCHLCEANCGIIISVEGRDVLSIKGDPDDPLSRGHICPKATAIADLESDPDRLRTPVKRMGDQWQPISWDTAYAEIASRFAALRAAGGEAAMYIGNPTAHNYSIASQTPLLRKALGAKAMFSASSVDQVPHQLVQLWMYGHNALFPIPDIDRTQHMVIIGGNPLASNGSVWTVPDVKQRIQDLQARGGRLTVIDPRRTETAAIADAHHFIRPGSDPALLVALLLALDEAGLVAPGRLGAMLAGWDNAWAALRQFDIAPLAAACGIDEAAIRALATELGSGEPAIVYGRIGVSTASFGTLNHWLINLINIATGNLDRVGGAMFSTPAVDIVGQTGSGTRGRFHSRVSGHPEVLGEFPAVAMAEEIATPGEGQIKALVTIAGNPVLSVPDGGALDTALDTLDLMVSIDMYVTATSAHADYILPPCSPLEKDHTRCSWPPSRRAISPIIRRRCSNRRRAPKAIGKSSPNSPAPSPAPPGSRCPTSSTRAKPSTGCSNTRRAGCPSPMSRPIPMAWISVLSNHGCPIACAPPTKPSNARPSKSSPTWPAASPTGSPKRPPTALC